MKRKLIIADDDPDLIKILLSNHEIAFKEYFTHVIILQSNEEVFEYLSQKKKDEPLNEVMITDILKGVSARDVSFLYLDYIQDNFNTSDFDVIIFSVAAGSPPFFENCLRYPFVKFIYLKSYYDARLFEKITLQVKNTNIFDLRKQTESFPIELSSIKNLIIIPSDTKIKDDFLYNFEDLENLNIYGSLDFKIDALPKSIYSLKKLEYLDISSNNITVISPEILNCESLVNLNFYGNPLLFPPEEIYDQGFEAMKIFLADLGEEKITSKEIKVIFIGNGGVGKTSLINWLKKREFQPINLKDRTHGVEISRLKFSENVVLNIWDFAGQEIFHATHRLFFTRKTLYFILWTPHNQNFYSDDNRNQPLDYWLDYTIELGKVSPELGKNKSKITVVETMMDLEKPNNNIFPQFDANRELVYNWIQLSTKSGRGLKPFVSGLQDLIDHNFFSNSFNIPNSWEKVKTLLSEKRDRRGISSIIMAEFTKICNQLNVSETSSRILLKFLHETGFLFYSEGLFEDRIILKQDWILNAAYKVLKSDTIELLQKGEFHKSQLENIWPENNEREIQLFLSFLIKCELIFEIDSKDGAFYIVPGLLPQDNKIITWSWDANNSIELVIRHKFLHRAIIERFIARVGSLAERAFWRKGVLLFDKNTNTKILVRSFPKKNYISVQAKGQGRLPWIRLVGKEFKKIRADENVEELISVNQSSFVNYESFLAKVKKGHSFIETQTGEEIRLSSFYQNLFEEEKINLGIKGFLVIREDINQLVANGKIKEALYRCLEWSKVFAPKYQDKYLTLSNRYNRLIVEYNLGNLSEEEKDLKINRLIMSLLDFLEKTSHSN